MAFNYKILLAAEADAAPLAALHAAVADHLTGHYGHGPWSSAPSERAVLSHLHKPKFSRALVVHGDGRIIAALRLATKKPWAIDTKYFSLAKMPLYLTGMAVHPDYQRKGLGRLILKEAEAVARSWPADTIRLDAFDSNAGAGHFYAKCGYREVARVAYKGNPLVYFELMLTPFEHSHHFKKTL